MFDPNPSECFKMNHKYNLNYNIICGDVSHENNPNAAPFSLKFNCMLKHVMNCTRMQTFFLFIFKENGVVWALKVLSDPETDVIYFFTVKYYIVRAQNYNKIKPKITSPTLWIRSWTRVSKATNLKFYTNLYQNRRATIPRLSSSVFLPLRRFFI